MVAVKCWDLGISWVLENHGVCFRCSHHNLANSKPLSVPQQQQQWRLHWTNQRIRDERSHLFSLPNTQPYIHISIQSSSSNTCNCCSIIRIPTPPPSSAAAAAKNRVPFFHQTTFNLYIYINILHSLIFISPAYPPPLHRCCKGYLITVFQS